MGYSNEDIRQMKQDLTDLKKLVADLQESRKIHALSLEKIADILTNHSDNLDGLTENVVQIADILKQTIDKPSRYALDW